MQLKAAAIFVVVCLTTQTISAARPGRKSEDGRKNHKSNLAINQVGSSSPTSAPTTAPSSSPTHKPTSAPTRKPTSAPSSSPTKKPTSAPTKKPTLAPSSSPTRKPTSAPTYKPTSASPSSSTHKPTSASTKRPTSSPTLHPTASPSSAPSKKPPTSAPTIRPTRSPPTPPPSNTTISCPLNLTAWAFLTLEGLVQLNLELLNQALEEVTDANLKVTIPFGLSFMSVEGLKADQGEVVERQGQQIYLRNLSVRAGGSRELSVVFSIYNRDAVFSEGDQLSVRFDTAVFQGLEDLIYCFEALIPAKTESAWSDQPKKSSADSSRGQDTHTKNRGKQSAAAVPAKASADPAALPGLKVKADLQKQEEDSREELPAAFFNTAAQLARPPPGHEGQMEPMEQEGKRDSSHLGPRGDEQQRKPGGARTKEMPRGRAPPPPASAEVPKPQGPRDGVQEGRAFATAVSPADPMDKRDAALKEAQENGLSQREKKRDWQEAEEMDAEGARISSVGKGNGKDTRSKQSAFMKEAHASAKSTVNNMADAWLGSFGGHERR